MFLKTLLYAAAFPALLFFFFSCDEGIDPTGDKGLVFTLVDQDTKTVAAGESGSFNVVVRNGDASPVSLIFVRKSNELPDSSWSSSLCAGGKCYPAFLDTVDVDIEAGRTDSCDVIIQAGAVAGTARVAVEIYDIADSTRRYEHTFSCTVAQ